MATRHQRFALREVTFGGLEMPGATVDRWEQTGGAWWSARIVTRRPPGFEAGEFVGRTLDGRLVSGPAIVTAREPAQGRAALVVFLGTRDLDGLDDRAS